MCAPRQYISSLTTMRYILNCLGIVFGRYHSYLWYTHYISGIMAVTHTYWDIWFKDNNGSTWNVLVYTVHIRPNAWGTLTMQSQHLPLRRFLSWHPKSWQFNYYPVEMGGTGLKLREGPPTKKFLILFKTFEQCCKFCAVLKAFWRHEIDFFFKIELSRI